jgi:hypothetical protein
VVCLTLACIIGGCITRKAAPTKMYVVGLESAGCTRSHIFHEMARKKRQEKGHVLF